MILDTNAYGPLRAGAPEIADFARRQPKLTFPVPVIAELQAGFLGGNRAEKNITELRELLSQPLIVVLNIDTTTTKHYSELHHYCRKAGKSLSNNDIWIAALAVQFDDTLVTYDKDFLVFENHIDLRLLSAA